MRRLQKDEERFELLWPEQSQSLAHPGQISLEWHLQKNPIPLLTWDALQEGTPVYHRPLRTPHPVQASHLHPAAATSADAADQEPPLRVVVALGENSGYVQKKSFHGKTISCKSICQTKVGLQQGKVFRVTGKECNLEHLSMFLVK